MYSWEKEYPNLSITFRCPPMKAWGNWILSLYELYIRDPNAHRYAIFQDDVVTSRNLLKYLESDYCPYPNDPPGYLNLITYPSNHTTVGKQSDDKPGWYLSTQNGRGAQGLVFSREAVLHLLSSYHVASRPMDTHRGHKSIDGGVVTALGKVGFKEYVHYPSLLLHVGELSIIGNKRQPDASSFRGEDFDLMCLNP